MDDPASGPGLYIHDLSVLGSGICLISITEEPRGRVWDYVLLEPTDLNSAAQTPTALLNSGKSEVSELG